MKTILNGLLLLAITSIYSQNTIEGIVTESNSSTPITFANIYLPLLEKGAITDDDGKFIISNLPSGNYKIIVSIIGYETFSKTISIPLQQALNISLISSAIEMEEVIISTPFHKLQSENVMKVERKKVSDLKAKGAVTLSEGITNIAGVESVTTGVSIGKPVIRGLSSNRVLVYTQGVRLENQQFGSEHGLGVSDAGIESVEVIKGPASLLYGSDALGGVLYLNPEKFAAQNTSSGDVNFNYFSNTQGYSTNAGFKTSPNNFKLIFRGSLAEHSDYKTKDYRVTNTRFREQDFKAGIGYQNAAFKTEFRYNINNLKTGIPETIGVQSTNKSPLLPFQEVTNHVFSSKSTVFFDNSSINITAGYLYNDRKEFEEFTSPALRLKLKTFNYDVKYNTPQLGKFETIVGIQGMSQSNTNLGIEQLIPDAITNDFGILAVSHIHFKKADLQLGGRYDTRTINIKNGANKNYNSFNSAIGIKTNLLEKLTARLNLASGFRAPNLAELTSNGVHEGTNRFEIGNISLTEEQSFQTDLALEFKNKHLEVFANAFYNKVKDYIFLSPNGNIIEGNDVFVYLQDDAKLYGGEFGLHFHPHPLDWLHIESSFETVTGKQDNGDYLPLIPANSVSNIFRVEFNNTTIAKGYVFIKLKTVFNQNKISSFETKTSGYNLLSVGFGGKVKFLKHKLSISVSGSNLTNKRYINHLSRLKTDGIFNIGRNFNVNISYTL
ncbi:TonB-dependent receptor [hydrothermal vent metagenome]|uniref:TonB-dependent receptor n=1 Tax=hydrothermal vent metagenome TaxID=652676 RepID=A0A3B0QSL1_9ZZZZ